MCGIWGFEFIGLKIELTLLGAQDLGRSGIAVLIETVPGHSTQALSSLQLESPCHAHPQRGLHSSLNHLTQSGAFCSLQQLDLVAPLEQLKAGKATGQQPCFIAT